MGNVTTRRTPSIPDLLALVLALTAVVLGSLVARHVFEDIPHLEDEAAYVWQAQAIAGGHLSLPTPTCPRCFLVPFVVDANGLRSGKYPPGWPVVLAFGEIIGARWLINPLLAGFSVWLIYRLGKKLLDERTALLAAFLTVTSPFFVMNSGTLLSHPWSLFLSAAFILAWLDVSSSCPTRPTWLPALCAGLSLGVLALTRPLTAVGVALPFAAHGAYLLLKGDQGLRRRLLAVAGAAAAVAALYLLWQFAVTGNALLNPYTLWWPYDTIGFGLAVGRQEGGYFPADAIPNLKVSLSFGNFDLFGWPGLSGIFLPFGLLAVLRKPRALLVSLVLPALVAAYMLYWIGSWLYGPRYYYEALISAVLLTAAGITWLAGRLAPPSAPGWQRWLSRLRFAGISGAVLFLVGANLLFYLPARVTGLTGLYGATRAQLDPFTTPSAAALSPALVIVHPQESWLEYGTLLALSTPYLNTPFIFIRSRGPENDQTVINLYPDRSVWHYYPDTPYKFYTAPRPEE